MLTKEPGWHPDPDGGRQVRFWDGEEWTDYVQPLAPQARRSHGPETAVVDYPYLADANIAPAREPRVVDTWRPDVVAPFTTTPGRARRRRSALPWWIAAGAAALVLVVVGVTTALRGQHSPLADPSPSSTVTASSAVSVGQSVTVDVPSAGMGVVTIDVAQDGPYLLEAVASGGDLAARLLADGDEIWAGDDRGRALSDIISGVWSDPAALVELSAGQYTIELTEHDAQATSAQVFLYPLDVVDLAPDSAPLSVSIPDGEYVVLALTLDAEQALTLDVQGAGSWDDPELTYFRDGVATLAGDRGAQQASDLGGSEWDPYLAATFPAGTSFVLIHDYSWDGIDVTVTVSPAP